MEDDHQWDGSKNLDQALTSNLPYPHPSKLQQTQLRECSMVVIRDIQHHNECSVFPPVNHENLHISSLSHQCDNISTLPLPSSTISSSFSGLDSSFSPSDTDTWGISLPLPSNSLVEKIDGYTGWVRISLKTLVGKLFAMVSSYRNNAANKSVIWSIGPAVSVVIFSWWMCIRVWCWLKERKRRREQYGNHLRTIIKEKDERIAQLLDRIVQMNEILVARHKALGAKLAE
ncbi:uncharacterized protein LOC129308801 [Prosopis cineraria]|uniref:uncharacterized protein LOC129308801 n=1 Tax=Prosopis cineraria TaxID=364024 RepID=UPI00240ED389|nr:uncharacterized protein LOC129308801 [Prosopis cineraria]XP_054806157.1 uncharacterized protein LOC129308801 [Prosopis cineraria]XP_054806158.1 uncharacterized protein LOC129308801 [Prosopis cineraria]